MKIKLNLMVGEGSDDDGNIHTPLISSFLYDTGLIYNWKNVC